MQTSEIIVTIRNGLVTGISATHASQIRTIFVKTIEEDGVHIKPCDPQEIAVGTIENHLFAEVCPDSLCTA